jgi:hypothetical protein
MSAAHTAFTNTGTITGNVTFAATESMTNHSTIFGNVVAGSGDYLVNQGTVHGNLTLGAADTLAIAGDVTNDIVAAASDLICFKGNFGNETVDSFISGSGTTHDTIQFWETAFTSFSQVQAASTAVGSETVIRMDSSDAITLVGVAPSSLVSADFKFV